MIMSARQQLETDSATPLIFFVLNLTLFWTFKVCREVSEVITNDRVRLDKSLKPLWKLKLETVYSRLTSQARASNMLLTSILALGLIGLVILILKPEPSPIFGIYSRPGKFYYLKFAAFYLLFSFRKVTQCSSL